MDILLVDTDSIVNNHECKHDFHHLQHLSLDTMSKEKILIPGTNTI